MLFVYYYFERTFGRSFEIFFKKLTSSRVYVLNPILQIYNLGAFTIQIPKKNQNLRDYIYANTKKDIL